jgi:hypothetical protein
LSPLYPGQLLTLTNRPSVSLSLCVQEEDAEDAPPRRARTQHAAPPPVPPTPLLRASTLSSDLADDAQVDLYTVLLKLGEHFAPAAEAEAAAAAEAEALQNCIVDFFTFANQHASDPVFEGQYKVVKHLFQQTPPNWAQLKRHVTRTCVTALQPRLQPLALAPLTPTDAASAMHLALRTPVPALPTL